MECMSLLQRHVSSFTTCSQNTIVRDLADAKTPFWKYDASAYDRHYKEKKNYANFFSSFPPPLSRSFGDLQGKYEATVPGSLFTHTHSLTYLGKYL